MPNAKSERETTEKKRENRENRGILIYSRSRRESIRKLFARARDMCECARSFFFKLFSFFYKVVYIYIYIRSCALSTRGRVCTCGLCCGFTAGARVPCVFLYRNFFISEVSRHGVCYIYVAAAMWSGFK